MKFTREEMKRLQAAVAKDPIFATRVWSLRDNAGLVAVRWSLRRKRIVGVYEAAKQGIDGGGDKWCTLCEVHGCMVTHRTRAIAESFASHPEDFCEDCRDGGECQL